MSDNLPFELQAEIMKRLPVKSLIQFTSVSKAWKSLISSSRFIKRYSGQQEHLLVKYRDMLDCYSYLFRKRLKYVTIVDDDTFPTQKVSLTPHQFLNTSSRVVGSDHGLLCLFDDYDPKSMAVLWNPTIRKAVAVMVPRFHTVDDDIYTSVLGFGVCNETNDPKIVKITCIKSRKRLENISCIPWQVEVFTLSTGAWRSPYSSIFPRKSIRVSSVQVLVNGCLYWLALDVSTSEFTNFNLITSFDLTSEEFKEVRLPDSLTRDSKHFLYLSKRRNSLVVLQSDGRALCNVWMMEDGVSKSFTKLFTICPPNVRELRVLEFRKSGEPVIEVDRGSPKELLSLAVYEPDSKHLKTIGIMGLSYVDAYKETLLLLDKPDLFIYGNTTPAFEA